MKSVLRLLIVGIAAFLPVRAPLAGDGQITAVDFLSIPSLNDARLSPDGKQILFVKQEADWEENKRIGHIWRVAGDGSDLLQLTNGEDGEGSPRWSPNGKTIAFLAKRGEKEKETQIYLISNRGGEARRLTKHPTSVSNITWSPDGAFLYFLAREEESKEEKKRKKAKDDIVPFEETLHHRHVWRVNVADETITRVTEGAFSVRNYSLSRDGQKIIHSRAAGMLIDERHQGELWLMNADGSDALQLTDNDFAESNPQISPDNSRILFTAAVNEAGEVYYNNNLFMLSISGGAHQMLLADMPHEVEDVAWSADGKSLFLVANMGVRNELFRYDLGDEELTQLTDGHHTLAGWNYSHLANRHVLSIRNDRNVGDLWLFSGKRGQSPERVTHIFDFIDEQFALPDQKAIQWTGADGTMVEGLLTYPIGYQNGQRYPLVVKTHGGPRSSDQYGLWSTSSYLPVLASRGYAILSPNYRGSTGYGDAFLRDMVGHYFNNSHLDVLAGVDHLIAEGIADPDQLIKMGWSAGGHMTSMLITKTDRFKAASVGAGAFDWVSMYGESDTRAGRTAWFGATPWVENAPLDLYRDQSPLKGISKVTTPTLVLVGERDVRVPASQSRMLFRALKSNGVETRLYIAPREPHGWRELRHRLFKINAEMDWFERHVRGRDYEWEEAPKKPETNDD